MEQDKNRAQRLLQGVRRVAHRGYIDFQRFTIEAPFPDFRSERTNRRDEAPFRMVAKGDSIESGLPRQEYYLRLRLCRRLQMKANYIFLFSKRLWSQLKYWYAFEKKPRLGQRPNDLSAYQSVYISG